MKKLLLSLAVMASATTMSADIMQPIFATDFGQKTEFDQWTQFGLGRTLMDNATIKQVWGVAGAKPYMPIAMGDYDFAASTSCFADIDTTPADEWLISPKFKMTSDAAIVYVNVVGTNASTLDLEFNTFQVKISDKGNQKADFPAENIGAGSLKGSMRSYVLPVTGYKDKDVYIALVNNSDKMGIIGFSSIEVAPYYAKVTNNTPKFSEDAKVSVTAALRTAVPCKGFTAVLKYGDKEQTYTSTEELSEVTASYDIVFPETVKVAEGQTVDYTVTITPNYDGAPSVEVKGLIASSVTYPRKVVVEEGTSTGCGYCPRGAVSLQMWHEIYGDKFIGIAVHANMASTQDPMLINGGAYLRGLGITGLPGGRANRKPGVTLSFMTPDEIDSYYKEVATAHAYLYQVDFDANKHFKVNYRAKMGYANSSESLSMAAVLIENNVVGSTSNYKQANYYSRTPKSTIVDQYGESWWPAFQKYCEGPSYISYKNMVHQHVARGIFPSYEGQKVSNEWERDTEIAGTIEFDLPASVLDETQTEVAILLIDDFTGEIVGADCVPFLKYNEPGASVEAIDAEAATRVVREGRNLVVAAEEGSAVEVFAADGTMLANRVLAAGETTIDGSAFSGLVIVKVSNGKSSVSRKLMF